MASVAESDCHKDPNFAAIISFLDKFGPSLGLPILTYTDLERFIEAASTEGTNTAPLFLKRSRFILLKCSL